MTDTDLSREIIAAAIEVHKELGPGLFEAAYEECLAHELQLRGFRVERQKPVPVVYKEVKVECGCRIDILVERRIVVEVKSVEQLAHVHEAVLVAYLRLSGYKLGLLINFNVPVLEHGVLRYILPETKNVHLQSANDAERAGNGQEKWASRA